MITMLDSLIEKLQDIRDQNGNLRVRVDSDEYVQSIHRIENIRVEEHRGEWYADIILT